MEPSNGGVLFTGASTGIGEATALHLDKAGFRVFAGVRKILAGEQRPEVIGQGFLDLLQRPSDRQ